jgi:hypothetical protein
MTWAVSGGNRVTLLECPCGEQVHLKLAGRGASEGEWGWRRREGGTVIRPRSRSGGHLELEDPQVFPSTRASWPTGLV